MDKIRREGLKNVCFCLRSGYKNCPRRGRGVKKWQNSVHVVVEWPLTTWFHEFPNLKFRYFFFYLLTNRNVAYLFLFCFHQNHLCKLSVKFVKIWNSGIGNWEFVKLCGEQLKYLNLFSKIRAHYWCSRTAVECWCCNLLKSRNSYRIKIRKKSERWFLAIIRITHQTMGWHIFWSGIVFSTLVLTS